MLPDVDSDADPLREYDANGHYWAGPKMARSPLLRLITSALGSIVDADTVDDAQRLRIARGAVAEFGGDVDRAWDYVKRVTTKRQRRTLHLKREDLVEARGWMAKVAA